MKIRVQCPFLKRNESQVRSHHLPNFTFSNVIHGFRYKWKVEKEPEIWLFTLAYTCLPKGLCSKALGSPSLFSTRLSPLSLLHCHWVCNALLYYSEDVRSPWLFIQKMYRESEIPYFPEYSDTWIFFLLTWHSPARGIAGDDSSHHPARILPFKESKYKSKIIYIFFSWTATYSLVLLSSDIMKTKSIFLSIIFILSLVFQQFFQNLFTRSPEQYTKTIGNVIIPGPFWASPW